MPEDFISIRRFLVPSTISSLSVSFLRMKLNYVFLRLNVNLNFYPLRVSNVPCQN